MFLRLKVVEVGFEPTKPKQRFYRPPHLTTLELHSLYVSEGRDSNPQCLPCGTRFTVWHNTTIVAAFRSLLMESARLLHQILSTIIIIVIIIHIFIYLFNYKYVFLFSFVPRYIKTLNTSFLFIESESILK